MDENYRPGEVSRTKERRRRRRRRGGERERKGEEEKDEGVKVGKEREGGEGRNKRWVRSR